MSIPPAEKSEALQNFISQSSLEQFKSSLPQLSFSELAESLNLLQTNPSIDSKGKLDSLFQFIDSPKTLEIFGSHFSVYQFLSSLNYLFHHPSLQDRLASLLVGVHPKIFSEALRTCQSHQLELLKQEGLLEPLHYHLTQFIHEGETLSREIEQRGAAFEELLKSAQSEELTPERLNGFIHYIDSMRNQLLDYLERAAHALSIVWHTDRVDLIDKLSSINEAIQHQLSTQIGHRHMDQTSSTGLYLKLERTFSSIYDSSLNDEDAAIDGLTRLSIWHLKDYWKLGLLPGIQQVEELDLDPKEFNEEKRLEHHQKLFSLVHEQLEKLKIGTVADLKKNDIYSKSLLKAYIDRHPCM